VPEPSLLDYLKSILSSKELPSVPPIPKEGKATVVRSSRKATPSTLGFQASKRMQVWGAAASIILFVLAQFLWAPPSRSPILGLILGGTAIFLAWRSIKLGAWRMPRMASAKEADSRIFVRAWFLLPALVLSSMAFQIFSGNRFSIFNTSLWLASIIFLYFALYGTTKKSNDDESENKPHRPLQWRALVVGSILLVAIFRFGQINQVPPEMNSDHAEKLFDVMDVLNGDTSIFFTRNTGREPLQFYLSAAIANVFGTGISFTTLKLGTTLLGFLSLFYVYKLGEEFGGPWVGLFAFVLAGVAYWPNVLARTGLRFILYPAFIAPTMLHLVWALRGKGGRHFVGAGLFMGIGLLGYTAFRIAPLLVVVALILFWLHNRDWESRRRAIIGVTVLSLASLFVFSPLLRYGLEPDSLINYRVATRLLTLETAYLGNPLIIFSINMAKALMMPFYDAGSVWLIGLLHRPALDYLSAALLMAGFLLVVRRYRQNRDWRDLFLLVSVPILLMPSALSIAYPIENPALNRAGGVIVPIFILCALALDALVHGIKDQIQPRLAPRVAWGSAIILLMLIAASNYDFAFNQYKQAYERYSWNSSEIGHVGAEFRQFRNDHIWVVAYPHWVDTRLVAIHAGLPGEDIGLWPEQLASTLQFDGEKLFMLNLLDEAGLDTLNSIYPAGHAEVYESAIEGKDFFVYSVPAEGQP